MWPVVNKITFRFFGHPQMMTTRDSRGAMDPNPEGVKFLSQRALARCDVTDNTNFWRHFCAKQSKMMTKINSHPNDIKKAFYTAVIKRKILNF